MRLLEILSRAALCASACAAGAQWTEPPSARCVIRPAKIRIDGALDDPAWSNALRLGPFRSPHGQPVKAKTFAKLACDGERLCVAFICHEPHMEKLAADHDRRDGDVFLDDCVEVFVDGDLDFHAYRHFLVSAANIQRDESGRADGRVTYDVKWNAQWRSAVRKEADRWTVEMAIPLSALGVDVQRDAVIGLNLCRSRRAAGELSVWSPTGGGFHAPLRFGTLVLTRRQDAPAWRARVLHLSTPRVGVMMAEGEVTNLSTRPAAARGELRLASSYGLRRQDLGEAEWRAGQTIRSSVPLIVREAGAHRATFVLSDAKDGRVLLVKNLVFAVPLLNRVAFGYRLPAPKDCAVWWCESTYKVMKDAPTPGRPSEAVRISAAGREYEPFQLVLRSTIGLRGAAVSVSDFRCGSHVLSARNFTIRKVEYVPVTIPTDSFGHKGDWPDPLPELKGRFDVKPNENTPLWIVAYVPAGTPAGEYAGAVTVRAPGRKPIRVPVKLRVRGFDLSKTTHTRTAYGVGVNAAFLGLKTQEQRDRVYDLYLQSCREHRISPYHPMAFHRIRYEVSGPQRRFRLGELELVLDEWARPYLAIYLRGRLIGRLENTMTQFEKKGVGWRGTGVNWPGTDTVKSVRVVERSPARWVLDVTGARTGTGSASRRYEITFRFVIPAGGQWFAARMLRLKNTDSIRYEARGYYYILRPAGETPRKTHRKGYSYWLAGDAYLGAVEPTGAASLGLAPIYVTRGKRWLKPGEAITAEQPWVIFFAGRGGADKADAAGKKLAALLRAGPPDRFAPPAGAALRVEERTQPSVTYDFQDFDRAARKYLDEWGFNGFNFRAMPMRLGPYKRFEPGFVKLHRRVFGPIVEHLRAKGWLDKAYSYWFDEPAEKDYPYVIQGMDLLGRNCPGLTRLLTEQPEPALIGHVDLWVPVLGRYKPEDAFERQAAGDQVWWYVCCGPRAPYPNNFIDHPAINHRIRFWMQEKYGVTGSLYWSTTYWWGKDHKLRNPWRTAMSVNSRGGHWGNGDGMLLYPACREPSKTPVIAGPVPSIRWELLREGLEDREYFWLLRETLRRVRARVPALQGKRQAAARFAVMQAERALGAPDRLVQSLTEYAKDPQQLFAARERLAAAIELCRSFLPRSPSTRRQ